MSCYVTAGSQFKALATAETYLVAIMTLERSIPATVGGAGSEQRPSIDQFSVKQILFCLLATVAQLNPFSFRFVLPPGLGSVKD
jgi:hypothetical protein